MFEKFPPSIDNLVDKTEDEMEILIAHTHIAIVSDTPAS